MTALAASSTNITWWHRFSAPTAPRTHPRRCCSWRDRGDHGIPSLQRVTELIGGAGDIRVLRYAILLGLPLLIACLATAGLTGQRLADGSRSAIVRRKQRRLQAAAVAGLLVLVPCALILNHLATAPATGGAFTALEITESVFGTVNLSLLALNFRDGRRMTRHRRTARPARLAGSKPAPMADNKL